MWSHARAVVIAMLTTLVVAMPSEAQQFVNGLAQPVFSTVGLITHNVWVEVPDLDTDRDGINDRIRIQVRRPLDTEQGVRLPIVMTASPYSGGTLPFPQHDITGPLYEPAAIDADGLDQRVPPSPPPTPPAGTFEPYTGNTQVTTLSASGYQNYFLVRGFIFVEAQNLGTGNSTGCPTIGGIEESLAMKAVINWFNGIGNGYDVNGNRVEAYWTTGNTAMIGVSYDGTLPLAAASTGVAGLKAIVPIAGVSSYYDHRRSYGVVINSNPTIGTDADTLFDNILSRRRPEYCKYMRDQIAVLKERETGDWTSWWEERDYTRYAGNFQAAVLISHGLNDLNTKPRMYARLWKALTEHNVPRKIWLNTGGHGDGANSGARQAAWRDELNRFWSQYLFGQDNNWTGGPRAAVQRSSTVWADYADWPVPGSAPTAFHLSASGNNTSGQIGVDDFLLDESPSIENIIDNSAIDATALVQAASSPHRLVYKSPVLTAPVHISGIPSVKFRMAFGQGSATVSAMVVQYSASGNSTIITRGWADPQNRHSVSQTYAIHPGEPYDIAFDLQPHDYVFPAGSRIGFVVMSSDRLFTLRPTAGRLLYLNPIGSTLTLPVVGGKAAFAAAATAPPAAPIDLTVEAQSPTAIIVNWSDQASNETGYKIERSSDGVLFSQVATVGADVSTYLDESSAFAAAQHYRVRAYSTNGGNSAYSNSDGIGVPSITSPGTATAIHDAAFSYQVAATWSPSTYAASGLPPGLAVDSHTGAITGSPQATGVFTITLSASNAFGNGTGALVLTIVDAAAPVFASLTASPGSLWPPNNKMVAVTLTAGVSDAVDPAPTTRIIGVSSDEPQSSAGDWSVTGPLSLNLRASRRGQGNGRVYAITVESRDDAGNVSTKDVTVVVPHNR
jgi:X-Pro dipeptidyl-peptidase